MTPLSWRPPVRTNLVSAVRGLLAEIERLRAGRHGGAAARCRRSAVRRATDHHGVAVVRSGDTHFGSLRGYGVVRIAAESAARRVLFELDEVCLDLRTRQRRIRLGEREGWSGQDSSNDCSFDERFQRLPPKLSGNRCTGLVCVCLQPMHAVYRGTRLRLTPIPRNHHYMDGDNRCRTSVS
jgi:hypothetical protein